MTFDKKLLFDEKSIRQEKDRGKEKSRAQGKWTQSVFRGSKASLARKMIYKIIRSSNVLL
ncbi:MAG: hypothetical protein A2Y79_14890 [Deltaproteobacteria bacterium RBG_13_43_22]|nr:MAG: hypothetical protein A2Y79_14890 [Deltaproteobacteria bacterium RBG_13_43_22]